MLESRDVWKGETDYVNYEKVTPSGREQFAANATGTHDDLVMAVALACWWTGRKV